MAQDTFITAIERTGTNAALGLSKDRSLALIFDTSSGFVVTYVDGVVTGPDGSSITGYHLVSAGAFAPTSITEPGDHPATNGFIRLDSAGNGIAGGASAGASAYLVRWNGLDATRALQFGDATDVKSVQIACTTIATITVAGAIQIGCSTSTTLVASPDGTSGTCSIDDGQIVLTSVGRLVIHVTDDQVIVSTTKTALYSPDTSHAIEVGNGGITVTGGASFVDAPAVPSVTVGSLPSASPAARIVYVSNESGGATLAFSDGTNWRRVQDRAVVS